MSRLTMGSQLSVHVHGPGGGGSPPAQHPTRSRQPRRARAANSSMEARRRRRWQAPRVRTRTHVQAFVARPRARVPRGGREICTPAAADSCVRLRAPASSDASASSSSSPSSACGTPDAETSARWPRPRRCAHLRAHGQARRPCRRSRMTAPTSSEQPIVCAPAQPAASAASREERSLPERSSRSNWHGRRGGGCGWQRRRPRHPSQRAGRRAVGKQRGRHGRGRCGVPPRPAHARRLCGPLGASVRGAREQEECRPHHATPRGARAHASSGSPPTPAAAASSRAAPRSSDSDCGGGGGGGGGALHGVQMLLAIAPACMRACARDDAGGWGVPDAYRHIGEVAERNPNPSI
eukprot:scaffold1258_cov272-Prasinococcus_capsulatus_cf.AAC.3